MQYKSTRGSSNMVPFHQAVLQGIAPDGGLFVPTQEVYFDSLDLADMSSMTYEALAFTIIKRFVDDIPDNRLMSFIKNAYYQGAFPPTVAPISRMSKTLSVLELWHGPTCAFKDMALQILPEFMVGSLAVADEKNEILILTATSGDTGKAALEGFKNKKGIKIMVFYPENGVSEMQKYQMITQEGDNVSVVAVRGNFDDAQTGVKEIFTDKEFNEMLLQKGYRLSSANSINWGRLLPQIIYYFYAYGSLVRQDVIKLGSKVNFVVPTGNFGNILACYYAMKAGLPVAKLICASNDNNILTDFFNTGTYDKNREFVTTISPAMDILVSSNLERLLYDISGEDDAFVSRCMTALKENGLYSVDKRTINSLNNFMWASYATEEETKDTIKNVYEKYNYLIDPHTAVGINVYDKYVISTGDMTKTICVSTASPFKFGKTVAESLFGPEAIEGMNEFEINRMLSERTNSPIPTPLMDLDKKKVVHNGVCDTSKMKDEVMKFLGI
ncbi:MAG: threonine synthase [Clostridiaceae bacterium]|nr:threonine synthase [Clostridiaceae bacterium]